MTRCLAYVGVFVFGFAANALQLTPQNVERVGAQDFQISWSEQGTLICNGVASIPTFRVPDDLPYGQWLECHVESTEGKSNSIRVLCNRQTCTAHVGREKNEFSIETEPSSSDQARTLIVERIVQRAPEQPKELRQGNDLAIPDGFALQIAARKQREPLLALASQYELRDTRIYAVQSGNEPYFVLIYGYFRTLENAVAAGERLPAGLPKPWIRTTADLKSSLRDE